MPKLRVTRPHAARDGIRVYSVGDEYEESPTYAREKVRAGFAEVVGEMETKEDPTLYRTGSEDLRTKESPKLVSVVSNWYTFSDGEKVQGKRAASDYLDVSVDELEALTEELDDGDSDSE